MNKKKNREQSNFLSKYGKKMLYRLQTNSMRRIIALALVLGLLAAVAQGFWAANKSYASSYVQVSVVYPEIADGKYPDGSRFSAFDMVSEERIEAVLSKMQDEGKYLYYTVDDLKNALDIHSYTDGSVAKAVSELRSEGNNYSYFANEYRITFTQPWDEMFSQEDDYSAEFLTALMEAELKSIKTYYGGSEGFMVMTDMGDVSQLDYDESVSAYGTRIRIAMDYLKSLSSEAGSYVSESTGRTIKELISRYEALYGETLPQIRNFIQVSGLSKDLDTVMNKLKIRVEDVKLANNKYSDKAEINKTAVDLYDHTFTENLIVVSLSDKIGLYQARPKTVFDMVVDEYNDAQENTVNTQVKLNDLDKEILLYANAPVADEVEYLRMTEKCDQMLRELGAEYAELNKITAVTLDDYLADINENYVTYKVGIEELFDKSLAVDAAMTGLAVAVLVFILYVIIVAVADFGKVCIKRRKLRRMRTYRDKLSRAE